MNNKTTIEIKLPRTLAALPGIMMCEKENSASENIHFKYIFFNDHTAAMSDLLKGRVDLLMTGFTEGLRAFFDGAPLQHMAAFNWGIYVVVTSDPAMKSLRDLADRRATVLVPSAGSPVDLQFRCILRKSGFRESIKIEHAALADTFRLLKEKSVLAAVVPEPLASQLASKNNLQIMSRLSDLWETTTGADRRSPQVSLFAKNSFVEKDPEIAELILRRLREATKSCAHLPEEQRGYFSELFNLNEVTFTSAMKNVIFEFPDAFHSEKMISQYLRQINVFPDIDLSAFLHSADTKTAIGL